MTDHQPPTKEIKDLANAEKSKGKSKIVFPFITTASLDKPRPWERKMIRSHVARGTGRPKLTMALKKPSSGSWLRRNDKLHVPSNVKSRVIYGPIACASSWMNNEAYAQRDSAVVNHTATSIHTTARARFSLKSLSFIPDTTPDMLDKIFRAYTGLSESLYPVNFCLVFDIVNAIWFKYLIQDPVQRYTILFLAEAYFSAAEGKRYGTKASSLLAKILPVLHGNLEDPTRATADSTISIIVALTMVADIFGDTEVVRKHIQGLHSIVALRGGISKLNDGELQTKCCRVDLQFAISTGSRPVFFTDSISWEPFFTYNNRQVPQPTEFDCLFTSLGSTLDPRLGYIWADAQEFCTTVNLAYLIRRKIQPRLFQEIMISLQYRLLHLSYLHGFDFDREVTPRDNLYEAVRLGTLAFTTTVFLKTANIEMRYLHLACVFKVSLLSLAKITSQEFWGTRLWLLVVAALSLFRSGARIWLKTALYQSLIELKITSWPEMKTILKGFLWIDMIHDVEGKRVFEWCAIDH